VEGLKGAGSGVASAGREGVSRSGTPVEQLAPKGLADIGGLIVATGDKVGTTDLVAAA